MNIEEFEAERSAERVTHLRKLHMNKYKRRNLLAFHWGHTQDEMKEARRNTKRMQRQREMTRMMLPLHYAEEAYVSFKNFVNKKRTGGGEDTQDTADDWSSEDSSRRYMNSASPTFGLVAPRHRDSGGLPSSIHSA